jgi:hypothetical protein
LREDAGKKENFDANEETWLVGARRDVGHERARGVRRC